MSDQSKIGNPKSKIVEIPPNVLARADRVTVRVNGKELRARDFALRENT